MTAIQSLLDWIHSDDSSSSSPTHISPLIDVKEIEGSGRGVFASSNIHVGSRLVTIPRRFLLNIQTIHDHLTRELDPDIKPFYAFLLQKYSSLLAFQIVVIYLCIEKHRESFWTPFISCLPDLSDFRDCPLVQSQLLLSTDYSQYWNLLPPTSQISAAKVLERFEKDLAKVMSLTSVYPSIQKVCGEESFLWAWMCINSRCLYMEQPLATTHECNFTLAPFVDFLNHCPVDQCTININATGFNVLTCTSYKPGDQLLFCYGPHSNDFLLAEYGFVLRSNNIYNTIDITHSLLALLLSPQKDFLQEKGYFGDYTLNDDGYSFLTQVALATSMEQNPTKCRPLNALINGQSDGQIYKARSDVILKSLLTPLINDCTEKLAILETSSYDSVKILYKNILDIAIKYI